LSGLDQVYYGRYNGSNIIIYLNMDVILFGSFSHVTIEWIQEHKVYPRAGCCFVWES